MNSKWGPIAIIIAGLSFVGILFIATRWLLQKYPERELSISLVGVIHLDLGQRDSILSPESDSYRLSPGDKRDWKQSLPIQQIILLAFLSGCLR